MQGPGCLSLQGEELWGNPVSLFIEGTAWISGTQGLAWGRDAEVCARAEVGVADPWVGQGHGPWVSYLFSRVRDNSR